MYQYPLQVAWEVTGRCNLNCLYCLNNSGEKRSELSVSERIRFAKELVSGGIMDVTISGGEPLLLPEIFELLKIFKDGGVKITFLTNGLLLNDEACYKLKGLVDVIQISLDTLDPDIFRELSNPNVDLKKVLDGIVNAVRHGLPLVIGSVVNKLNYHEISGIAEFCLRSGIKQYSLSEMMMMGRARANKDRLLIGEAERLAVYAQVERYKGLLKITAHEPCISFKLAEKKNNVCDCSLVSCSVAYNGDVFPCSYIREKMGSIEENTLKEIWDSSKLEKYRAEVLKRPAGKCAACEKVDVCMGGCKGLAWSYSGDINAENPICIYNKVQ